MLQAADSRSADRYGEARPNGLSESIATTGGPFARIRSWTTPWSVRLLRTNSPRDIPVRSRRTRRRAPIQRSLSKVQIRCLARRNWARASDALSFRAMEASAPSCSRSADVGSRSTKTRSTGWPSIASKSIGFLNLTAIPNGFSTPLDSRVWNGNTASRPRRAQFLSFEKLRGNVVRSQTEIFGCLAGQFLQELDAFATLESPP